MNFTKQGYSEVNDYLISLSEGMWDLEKMLKYDETNNNVTNLIDREISGWTNGSKSAAMILLNKVANHPEFFGKITWTVERVPDYTVSLADHMDEPGGTFIVYCLRNYKTGELYREDGEIWECLPLWKAKKKQDELNSIA